MKQKLTSRYIETVKAPGPKRLEVYDQLLPGFGVRVSTTGRKTWFCSARTNGRTQRVKIGTYPAVGLADARERAQSILHDAQLGITPPEKCETLGETIPMFIAIYAKPRNKGWLEQQRLLTQKWVPLFKSPLDEISRPDVVRVLDAIVASGTPGRANHALSALKKLMNWALDRGMIEVNPIAGLKPPTKPRARDRVLTDGELARLMDAAKREGYPFGTIAQVLLLTAQRRGEVSGMKWSSIDFETGVWTIPRENAKNGLAHDVPLSVSVLDLLRSVPRFVGSDYVFTTTGKTPVSGYGRAKDRLDDAVGTEGWWYHDLRRTAASGMARIGVSPHVIEKVLNHKSGIISGVAAIYNRYSYSLEKKSALEQWGEYIAKL
ncbi:tyrosine-type recombinase/integrase [Tabrizicola sp. BL-A-41-H6]|uniref:tyrosine-type recombinase/integrase n=1 Tax=Tabrizicola sp. BL-A-41-H6 TaxID=3421107 RepID=UPI003D673ECA